MLRNKIFLLFVVTFYFICLVQIFAGLREDWPFSYFGMFKARAYEQHIIRIDVDLLDRQSNFKKSIYDLGFDSYDIIRKLRSILLKEELDISNYQTKKPDFSLLTFEITEETKDQLVQYLNQEIVYHLYKRNPILKLENRFYIVLRLKYWEHFNSVTKDNPTIDRELYVHQL